MLMSAPNQDLMNIYMRMLINSLVETGGNYIGNDAMKQLRTKVWVCAVYVFVGLFGIIAENILDLWMILLLLQSPKDKNLNLSVLGI